LSVVLSKRESNESVLSLSLHYCDAIIEAYDVLVALLETENSMLQSADLSPRDRFYKTPFRPKTFRKIFSC
jgi:hypothetical protein